MPTLLKQRTENSPGIITFTINEVLWGVVHKSKKVRDYINETSKASEWIYGVHFNGYYSQPWPFESWQSFIMFPDTAISFLALVPPQNLTPLTCLNFLPDSILSLRGLQKEWDICVISRPSEIKRITETLYLLRELLNLKPDLKVVMVVPDPRKLELGEKAYFNEVDRNFFELPKTLFSCNELRNNLSFICSSQPAFGNFPVSNDLVCEFMARSKFLLLTSHSEGGPRVVAEAFLAGTPCIVSNNLKSGIQKFLTTENTIFIDDDANIGAQQVLDGLCNYERYNIDQDWARTNFSEATFIPQLRDYLSRQIRSRNLPVEGEWYLNDLHLRLPCHGQKNNYQFMNNETLFFDWIEKINCLNGREPSEDFLFGSAPLSDAPIPQEVSLIDSLKGRLYTSWRMMHAAQNKVKMIVGFRNDT